LFNNQEENNMSISLSSNVGAANAALNLSQNSALLQKSLQKLSSGRRIVSASDDAGGLAVSMRLSAQVQRLSSAQTNVGNAKSFIQVQDGALKSVGSIVDRMSELRAMTDDVTKNTSDKENYGVEFQQLREQLNSITSEQFNGVALFGNFSAAGGASFGTDLASAAQLTVYTSSEGSQGSTVTLGKLALQSSLQVQGVSAAGGEIIGTTYSAQVNLAGDSTTSTTASITTFAMGDIIQALGNVATLRAENGALSSRLDFASDYLTTTKSNVEAANSAIIDTDIATESSTFARRSIMVQASAAMLAQANATQGVALQILGGI
jgi:flagellin